MRKLSNIHESLVSGDVYDDVVAPVIFISFFMVVLAIVYWVYTALRGRFDR